MANPLLQRLNAARASRSIEPAHVEPAIRATARREPPRARRAARRRARRLGRDRGTDRAHAPPAGARLVAGRPPEWRDEQRRAARGVQRLPAAAHRVPHRARAERRAVRGLPAASPTREGGRLRPDAAQAGRERAARLPAGGRRAARRPQASASARSWSGSPPCRRSSTKTCSTRRTRGRATWTDAGGTRRPAG